MGSVGHGVALTGGHRTPFAFDRHSKYECCPESWAKDRTASLWPDNREVRRDSDGQSRDGTRGPLDLRILSCSRIREEEILEWLPRAEGAEVFSSWQPKRSVGER